MLREVTITRMGALVAVCGLAAPAIAGDTLVTKFSENFDEGWVLGPNIEEGALQDPSMPELGTFTGPLQDVDQAFFGDANDGSILGGNDFDGTWTQNGWRQTFNLRGFGVAEWEGWSVANGLFWSTADDQRRSEFVSENEGNDGSGLASGNVLVADPDEWDDFDPLGIDPESQGPYNTEIFTPVFPIGGTDEGSMVVTFDSSWRPEADSRNQQAELSVSYDGGDFVQLFRWSSDATEPEWDGVTVLDGFKNDESANETITIALDGTAYPANPGGASTMQLKFEMYEAGNDWWWAIDNIFVAGTGGDPVLPPEEFSLNTLDFYDNALPAFDWTLSINATQYTVEFARDEAFSEVLFSTVTSDLFFEAEQGDLDPGVYFVRVTASNPVGTLSKSAVIGLDSRCPSDLDGNGTRDLSDITRFLNDFLGTTCN